ncbi:NAD-dependent dehydratase [Floricoccus tropicus]|uniref:NAD-dependent dehydratase n=1 Tax=Floricoccus tropicus TaxID=1859473 RepID=A0A1E8GN72_9LACT|nr:SDR family oxidoreductase [Floricoccus tropicus]OFI49617.1 NAD-dependent dehydratase [Floricoccus tropicus]
MNILIVGANGQIAREAIDLYLENTDFNLTLFLRNSSRLASLESDRVKVIEGDVTNLSDLVEATKGMDVVYLNLAGPVEEGTKNAIAAMKENKVDNVILITTLGIYDEVPGEFGVWNNANIGPYFGPYRAAADALEASGLSYTVLRPAWLTNKDEIDYETTEKNEPFKGTEVSRKSVADLVVKASQDRAKYHNKNLGVDKPGTDGPKPSWY